MARARLGHSAKRWLFLVHRWLGIATCLLFAVWLLSGLVMIYVPFPSLGKAERLAGLSPIDWTAVRVSPEEARGLASASPVRALTLEMRDRAPVWRIEPWNGDPVAISAVTGSVVPRSGEASAHRIASDFGDAPIHALTSIDRDQWTVAGSFDRHRPLWKAELSGDGGRVLYVSSQTGEVVLDTSARERAWNWLGSVPHWIYPTVLRQNNPAWRQVVMWVSGPCIVVAFSGLWIGVLRLRTGRRRYGGGRMTPYRGWMTWHHVGGLAGGLFLLTWIFSGWLSVDPGRLFASPGLSPADRIGYAGVDTPLALSLDALERSAAGARRVIIRWSLDRPQALVERGSEPSSLLDGTTLSPLTIDERSIVRRASALVPAGKIVAVDRLTEADAHWYEKDGRPLLPVLRIRYDDPARSWAYVDPASGLLVSESDARRRAYRWAFDLLHKWDFTLLTEARPARDILLWAMSLAGLIIAVSGVIIGWRRLRR